MGRFQASRASDAVYRYLEAVFAIVEHYKVRRKTNKLLRHALEFADLPFDKHADPFTTVIRCTCDDDADSKTISKWARALRYIAHCKAPRTRLKTFMKKPAGSMRAPIPTRDISVGAAGENSASRQALRRGLRWRSSALGDKLGGREVLHERGLFRGDNDDRWLLQSGQYRPHRRPDRQKHAGQSSAAGNGQGPSARVCAGREPSIGLCEHPGCRSVLIKRSHSR